MNSDKSKRMKKKSLTGCAAILVDFQADFTSAYHGPLAAMDTDLIYLEMVRQACQSLRGEGIVVIATQDWHPKNHVSFTSNYPGAENFQLMELSDGRQQRLWPDHCIQNTAGARLLVDADSIDHVVRKGVDGRYDSYSGFYDDGGIATELPVFLKDLGVFQLLVFGLATDYCVQATAADALKEGYEVSVISGLSRAVTLEGGDRSLREMSSSGITIYQSLQEIL